MNASDYEEPMTVLERLAIMQVCGNCSEEEAWKFILMHPELYPKKH